MSLVPGPKLKTPWAIPRNIFDPPVDFTWQQYVRKEALEWAFGEGYGSITFSETPIVAYERLGLIINSFETVIAGCRKIQEEWEKSGSIIPGKRMVLIEKRVKDEQ